MHFSALPKQCYCTIWQKETTTKIASIFTQMLYYFPTKRHINALPIVNVMFPSIIQMLTADVEVQTHDCRRFVFRLRQCQHCSAFQTPSSGHWVCRRWWLMTCVLTTFGCVTERQAWCNLQVELCDPCLSASRLCLRSKWRNINTLPSQVTSRMGFRSGLLVNLVD